MKVVGRLACFVVVIAIGFNASAQEITGKIRGSVSDPAGAVVQAATVTATQTETGLTRSTTTNSDGTYLILNHTNFHLPNSDISSRTFNHILKAEDPRLIRFGVKLRY